MPTIPPPMIATSKRSPAIRTPPVPQELRV